MSQAWKVLWKKDTGKTFRRFEDPKPTEAIAFAKKLKREGFEPVVISANKAYPPTKKQEEKRRAGDMWCPYCIRWRSFKLYALKRKNYTTDAFLRCPVCTISTNDFFVRKYNGMIERYTEAELIKRLASHGRE